MQPARYLDQIEPSYIREILAAASAEGVISLAGGLPCADHFPMSLLREPLLALAQQPALFQYGCSRGHGPLLEYLRAQWQLPADNDLLICNGSQQALDLVARAFIERDDGVAMEAPCYLGALQVFALAGARIELVAQDCDGPDIMQLETLFAGGEIKLFYAVPDFHNPTGRCWSQATRRQVASLCTDHGVTLVEDAPYRELRFAGRALPLVSDLCPQHALVLRSFSKISAPGLRLGVVSGSTGWIDSLLKVKQVADLHTNVPLQEVMLQLLMHPQFPRHLRTVRASYLQRYQSLGDALTQHMNGLGRFAAVEGGMFLWLELAAGDPQLLASRLLERGVAVVPGSAFYPPGFIASPALRLNFSNAQPADLHRAAKIIGEVATAALK
jgi:2-aminoadipate transaminase